MQLQSNPYLIWLLIPGIITLGIGLYIQSRPIKKRESGAFVALMLGGAIWAFATAIRWLSPDPAWQQAWDAITYLGIMTVPTAWFLLAAKLTGYADVYIERYEKWFWLVPALMYFLLLTNPTHRLFFNSSTIVDLNGFAVLEHDFRLLFFIHTAYSYLLMITGIVILTVSLALHFDRYGVQGYGLLIGVLAPLIGNAYYLFAPIPLGFPDPTPMTFTVTGIAFGWSIFGGRILEVVPLAHDVIVQKLSTGVVILDAAKNVQGLNPAAIEMLGLPANFTGGGSFASLVQHNTAITAAVIPALDSNERNQELVITLADTGSTFETLLSRLEDSKGGLTGWLIQFSDVSEQMQAEASLATARDTLDAVLDTLQDSYFEADREGVLTYVNQGFVNAVAYEDKTEIIGKHFRHFTHSSSIRLVFESTNELYKTGKPYPPYEYKFRRKDGTIRVCEIYMSPVIRRGKVVSTRGLIRDITERVKGAEALKVAMDQVEARASELAVINRVANISSRSLDLNEILQSACRELTQIFNIRNAGVGLITPDKRSIQIVAFHSADPNEQTALGMTLPLEGNRSSLEVVEKRATIVIADAQTDPLTSSLAELSRERGTKSIMIVPLLTRGEAIGTIGMPAKDPNHVFTEDEVKLAETIANQMAAAIDNAQMHARTEKALDVAEQDLEIGRQIQAGFFPDKLPEIAGWELAAHFRAARQVAGDFYDMFQFKNTNLTAFIIADVCDKGVGAALFMVLFRSLLRAFSETKINIANSQEQLLHIIQSTNDFIAEYHGESNMFATLFFGILDPDSGRLCYVNGGHEPPVILNERGEVCQRLMPTGPAVGLFTGMEFRVESVAMEQGDTLIGFTDGTTDAKNDEGAIFSEERLIDGISGEWSSIFSMLYQLNTDLQRHIGTQRQFDDITLIAFRRKAQPTRDRHTIRRSARIEMLGELRSFVQETAEYCGLKHDDVLAFKLAADEVCTNIIEHGFHDADAGLVALQFEVEDRTARLTIRDDGQHFSPDQAKTPDLDEDWSLREEGGLGIYFIKELMDDVTYTRENGSNVLVLEKQVK